jgi:hypothetical protein
MRLHSYFVESVSTIGEIPVSIGADFWSCEALGIKLTKRSWYASARIVNAYA